MIDLHRDNVNLPVSQIPQYRVRHAFEKGNLGRILLTTFAGLGDHVCAEPTLRFAINARNRGEVEKVALCSSHPELYAHLDFDAIYLPGEWDQDEWYVFQTVPNEVGLAVEFTCHNLTNCVDASSLYAFRMQLPVAERSIRISSRAPSKEIRSILEYTPAVVIHAGAHWPSKTFPPIWWNAVIDYLSRAGIEPILIGADVDGKRTTVSVEATGCLDLRGKTTLPELAWICQRAKVLLTNDSLPLHLAASTDPHDYENTGNTWTGFIATAKHPDLISHYRKGVWSWREQNFGLGGMWEQMGFIPNKHEDPRIDLIDPHTLRSWLPRPEDFAKWAIAKMGE